MKEASSKVPSSRQHSTFSISLRGRMAKEGLEPHESQSPVGLLSIQERHSTQCLSDLCKVVSVGDTDSVDFDTHTCLMSEKL